MSTVTERKSRFFQIMEDAAKQDPRWKERRVSQYQRDMEYFSGGLFRLFTIMPSTKIYRNGQLEEYIAPEWQAKIDRIIAERDKYVKENYSDLFQFDEQ